MASRLNPYLTFDGTAQQAMEFYQDVLGGQLDLSHFSDFPQSDGADAPAGVMHALLEAPNGFVLMASDTPPGMDARPVGGFSISLSGDDERELRGYWDRLSADGQVTMPLELQMWGDTFGMCVDRFGTPWMVNIAGQVATTGAGAQSATVG